MPLTRRWVARIFSPGEYMLTNVIITRSAPEIGEEARGVFHKALRQTLRGDAAYQAMGRENLQPRRVHVDECHHYAIGSRDRRRGSRRFSQSPEANPPRRCRLPGDGSRESSAPASTC